MGRALKWLEGCSEAGIHKVLKRLGFSRKKALAFVHSPDPAYRAKWQRVLAAFYVQLSQAYPQAQRIYLVQDNWPTHKSPTVLAAAQAQRLTVLFLPTYASWLNPIEKLWRWLRQRVVHSHPLSHDLKELRRQVAAFLEQFAHGSLDLLLYVGLLTKEEFADVSVFFC